MTEIIKQPVLNVQNLTIGFGAGKHRIDIVKNLSFKLMPGETMAIVGESGCGKSVTSLAIMRLIEQGGGSITSGSILLKQKHADALDLAKASVWQIQAVRGADIAMIFQEPMTSLNPVFSIGAQIVEAIVLHQQLPAQQAKQQAIKLLKQVRIAEAEQIFERYPHQLSGGMRQRVMIAMALSCQPSVLIADEPTTALDVTVQAQIVQLMLQLQQELQMGLLFITHDMGLVAQIADRVMVMYQGQCVETGQVKQIFNQPQHSYTKALLNAVPKLGSMRGTTQPKPFELLQLTDAAKQQSTKATPQVTAQLVKLNDADALPPSNTNQSILQVQDLVVRFALRAGVFNRIKRQVHAVEKINFSLYPGQTLSLVGESGCGKSTTGRALSGLIEAQSGQIIFDGQAIKQFSATKIRQMRRNIQFVFQDPYASLDPRLTIGYSIMQPMLIHRLANKQQARQRAGELLELVGLSSAWLERYPHEFSGGQRQRICIARALSVNPKVIILDEAVSSLDVSVQAQVINLLLELQQRFNIAFLFISHNMAVVERVSHQVAVMYLGQIVEFGSRQAVFENPQHPYTKQLLAAVPIANPNLRQQAVSLDCSEPPSPIFDLGFEPLVEPLVQIEPHHFVAKHQIANFGYPN